MKTKKLLSSITALAVTASAFVSFAVTANADNSEILTSTASAYATKSGDITNGSDLASLPVLNTQFRASGTSANGSVKFNTNDAKLALYQFDISSISGNVTDAVLKVEILGTGDGKDSYNAYVIGYNGTLSEFSNIGANGDLTGTVTDPASFQPLDTSTSFSTGTKFPSYWEVNATQYVKSAMEADKDNVNFAVVVNLGRQINVATTATLSIETVDSATYTVNYSVNGNNSSETVVEGGSPVSVPTVNNYVSQEDRAEYTFSNWTDGENTYTTDELKNLTITSDKTFTAQYTKNEWASNVLYQNTVSPISVTNARGNSLGLNVPVGDYYSLAADIATSYIGDSTTHYEVVFQNENGDTIAGLLYYAENVAQNNNTRTPGIYFITKGNQSSSAGALSPVLVGSDNYVQLVASGDTNPGTISAVFVVDQKEKTVSLNYNNQNYVLPLNNAATSVKALVYGGFRTNSGSISNISIIENEAPVVTAPTATYKHIGDYTSETGDNNVDKGSAYYLYVTPGTETITSVGVKVNDTAADKTATTTISEGTAVFAIAVNAHKDSVTSIKAVLNNEDVEATETIE